MKYLNIIIIPIKFLAQDMTYSEVLSRLLAITLEI